MAKSSLPKETQMNQQQHLKQHFSFMSDKELLAKAHNHSLTDEALVILNQEISQRGLGRTTLANDTPEITDPTENEPIVFEASSALQTIGRYLNLLEAKIHCSLLVSEGIQAVLADENTVQSYNYIAHAMGGVRLQVPGNQIVQAQQILAEARSGQRILSHEFLDELPASEWMGNATEKEIDNSRLGYWAIAGLFVFLLLVFI